MAMVGSVLLFNSLMLMFAVAVMGILDIVIILMTQHIMVEEVLVETTLTEMVSMELVEVEVVVLSIALRITLEMVALGSS
jgi:hypothetical protein